MKKVILTASVFAMLSLTSCSDYMREQDQKDAQSDGKSILMKAEYSKKAEIEEAKSRFESAKINIERVLIVSRNEIQKAENELKARTIRAKAKEKEIEIIANALGGRDNYMTYVKYEMMYSGKGNKYFVATEGSLPIITNAK
jgi:hypothetical protein